MGYSLGLDIGPGSIGWAVLDMKNKYIKDRGVYVFPEAKSSEDHRNIKSSMRNKKRQKKRLKQVYNLTVTAGMGLPQYGGKHGVHGDGRDLAAKNHTENARLLRVEGLNRLLTKRELAIVMYNIAKFRGYKSNRKDITTQERNEKDAEKGKVLSAIARTEDLLRESGYKTVSEFLIHNAPLREGRIRNRRQNYTYMITRSETVKEIQLIFKAQQQLGSEIATKDLLTKYIDIYTYQLSYDYKQDIYEKIGFCTFEKSEKRAPKRAYSAEMINAALLLKNMKYIYNGKEKALTQTEIEDLLIQAHKQKDIKYQAIRKSLNIPDNAIFKAVDRELERKKIAINLSGYHEIKAALGADHAILKDRYMMDKIAEVLSYYSDNEIVFNKLTDLGVTKKDAEKMLHISFTQTASLSLKVYHKIYDDIVSGFMSMPDALEKHGYKAVVNTSNRSKYLPVNPYKDITNKSVLRLLSKTRGIVNTIVDKHGSPERVVVSLAREIGKTPEERAKIARENAKREKANIEIAETIKKEFGIQKPTGRDIVKYKLWLEQNQTCIYSGNLITKDHLFDGNYCEVSHIIPWVYRFSDAFSNKTLSTIKANRQKGDYTPYEAYGSNDDVWREYLERIKSLDISRVKYFNYTSAKKGVQYQEEYMAKTLNDTRYAAKVIKDYINAYLMFDSGVLEKKQQVIVSNGAITSYVRKSLRLPKDLQTYRHHAIEAMIIAGTDFELIKKVTKFDQLKNQGYDYKDIRQIGAMPEPWPGFRKEIFALMSETKTEMRDLYTEVSEIRTKAGLFKIPQNHIDMIKPLLVVRTPRKKALCQLHKQTYHRCVINEKGEAEYYSKKIKDINEPKISKKANFKNAVKVKSGYVQQNNILRIDVYKNAKGKHDIVPIYSMDIKKIDTPAADSDNYLYSLYKDSLIKYNENYYYYKSFNTNSQVIKVRKHDIALGDAVSISIVSKQASDRPIKKIEIISLDGTLPH